MPHASEDDIQRFMGMAFAQAENARIKNEVPIGAVIVQNGSIIAKAHNLCETKQSPLQHAELLVIQKACRKLGNWRLSDCDLYVTLEPCPMCLGALFQARIRKLYFGCPDHKRAKIKSNESCFGSLAEQNSLIDNNHNLLIQGGILQEQCSQILKDFFKKKRHQ